MDIVQVGSKKYELLKDHKEGWDPETFNDRYSEVLDRYDVIVGDWGYSQLRLKGFFQERHGRTSKDSLVQTIEDYIIEHCNFGCAYFVLRRIRNAPPKQSQQQHKKGSQKAKTPAK